MRGIPIVWTPGNVTVLNGIDARVNELRNNVASISQQISSMQSALAILSSLSGAAQPVQVNKALDTSPHGKSYAAAASVDIFKAVKSAVAEGLRTKNQDNNADASVMIFRLLESKNDLAKVHRLLEGDTQSVIHICWAVTVVTSGERTVSR